MTYNGSRDATASKLKVNDHLKAAVEMLWHLRYVTDWSIYIVEMLQHLKLDFSPHHNGKVQHE